MRTRADLEHWFFYADPNLTILRPQLLHIMITIVHLLPPPIGTIRKCYFFLRELGKWGYGGQIHNPNVSKYVSKKWGSLTFNTA